MAFRLAVPVVLLFAACTRALPSPDTAVAPVPGAADAGAPFTVRPVDPADLRSWEEIDRLVDDQKFQEALGHAENRLEYAKGRRDEPEWTRALIRVTQLRSGLHGYETAVRFLREQPWPKAPLHRAVLQLFYARAIQTYVHAHQWEIRQRERVEAKGAVDLRALTVDQLYAEIHRAYQDVWAQRESLGKEPVEALGEYIRPNDYPRHVRGTLRDAVAYLWVQILSDATGWRPEHENEIFRLDWAALIRADAEWVRKVDLVDPAVHPLTKMAAVLGDLEHWHQSSGRKEAALEARLERLRRLHAADADDERRARVRADLEAFLPAYEELPWWAMGMSTLAEFQRDAGMLVRAYETASKGEKRYPGSVGGKRCRFLRAGLEAPDFSLQAMLQDGAGKRSIEITHKNLPALYFRAYAVDLAERLRTARDYDLLPAGRELRELAAGTPVAEWEVKLPKTPDLQHHRTFTAPPLQRKGLYVILASARPDFADDENRILGLTFIVTDLALVSRMNGDGSIEVQVRDAGTGAAVPSAAVSLHQYDYQRGHHPAKTRRTDREGWVKFEPTSGRGSHSYFVVAEKVGDIALDSQGVYFGQREAPGEQQATILYTDRSIYRPLQTLHWKAITFRGDRREGRLRVAPDTLVTVRLLDPNGETVAEKSLRSNAYGSVAGEFQVPAGRLLGGWSLRASPEGFAQIRVEEYKRPTFQAELEDPEGALRLNQPATLQGKVHYYFGLPVVTGTVRWQVTREPIFPWWWGEWGWHPPQRAHTQVIATGTTTLDDAGRFRITFTPEAEAPKTKKDRAVSYRYRVVADVTDEGGETRTAERVFRLGWVAVDAQIRPEQDFFVSGSGGAFAIHRTDLDGTPRPGKGTWRVVSLKQPEARMPADLPPEPRPEERPEGQPEVTTPGDRLRPRWQTHWSFQEAVSRWEEGAVRVSGEVTHGEDGRAQVVVPPLPPGAYRIRYETKDAFGATFEAFHAFVVAGDRTPLAVPALLDVQSGSAKVGERLRVLATSGFPDQPMVFEVFRGGERILRRELRSGHDPAVLTLPVTEADRGGFTVVLTMIRDHQMLTQAESVFVPWDDRELKVEFATFRDKLRPGTKETWRVTVKGPGDGRTEAAAAELLAYMYDEALDVFAPHVPPSIVGLYPGRIGYPWTRSSFSQSPGHWLVNDDFVRLPPYPALTPDALRFFDGYGIGGPGARFRAFPMSAPAPTAGAVRSEAREEDRKLMLDRKEVVQTAGRAFDAPAQDSMAREDAPVSPAAEAPLRQNFAETAIWIPQLLTGADGSATIEFTVPDAVTGWNVWVHAVTKDLRGGSVHRKARSVKELMVRPYVPRFLREGDRAEVKVVVDNASDEALSGTVTFDVIDPGAEESLLSDFGLDASRATARFEAGAGAGASVTFALKAPTTPGNVAFRVTAKAGAFSDGELRPLPVLPGRVHLAQSRFVTLRDTDRAVLRFEDMARGDDPTLRHDQLVVNVDAQLFHAVLEALPYLVNYPYECTEQTLNRFVSTGVLASLYDQYPAVAAMAKKLSKREAPLETWAATDPNRRMALEETPWLVLSRGGEAPAGGVTNVLDPRIARAEREAALAKLRKAQTANGAFPWWPGGPPSPYMTLYILHGLARAAEYGVEIPRDMTQRAWGYIAQHFRAEYADRMIREDCCWEFLTFLNYVASSYPDETYTGQALTMEERRRILDHSFRHWKAHSPYLKGQLALTLKRMGREADAQLVFASVMDSSKTTEEEGTFWAPEERAWLWYNDTIETHAFALRTLMELEPADARRHGLVQWLLLNKKLNHWKSTRATAEAIYALTKYLEREGALGTRETTTVTVGPKEVQFAFDPREYTGRGNQVRIPGPEVDPKTMSTIQVEKAGKGFAFASATWHFSTDRLPAEARGDFFEVDRRYFKRERKGGGAVLRPLSEGTKLEVGDEVEVHLSIRTKHAAEYVHLRDPRAAGLEPENPVSRYKGDLGIVWYEETRDSGTNFFFEWLPAGEYTFKYRLRVNMAGDFRVGPATVQSMYAPEFNAYSSGAILRIGG